MATPLTIKQPGAASHVKQYLLGALLILPLVYLRSLKNNGAMVHYAPPLLNLLAHAAIVLLPLFVAYAAVYKPFEFRDSSERILEPQTFWPSRPSSWWMLFLLWSGPFLALFAVLYEAPHLMRNAAIWATGPGSAFFTMALVFALGIVFGTLLRERTQVRLSEEGLRSGLVHFHEWENIDHISVENDTFGIYNRVNPSLPFSYFRLKDAENRRILVECLDRHAVRQTRGPEPLLMIVKSCVAATAAVIVGVSFWLYLTTNIDLRWLIIGALVVSVGATMLLEVVRGVAKVTTTKPLVEPEASVSGAGS